MIEWEVVGEFLTAESILDGLLKTIVMAPLAMLLGLVLGATTLVGVGKAPTNFSPDAANVLLAYSPLWIPALVVAIPILDAVLAIVRRVRGRRNVFHADKEHLHHRLMDLGHGQK